MGLRALSLAFLVPYFSAPKRCHRSAHLSHLVFFTAFFLLFSSIWRAGGWAPRAQDGDDHTTTVPGGWRFDLPFFCFLAVAVAAAVIEHHADLYLDGTRWFSVSLFLFFCLCACACVCGTPFKSLSLSPLVSSCSRFCFHKRRRHGECETANTTTQGLLERKPGKASRPVSAAGRQLPSFLCQGACVFRFCFVSSSHQKETAVGTQGRSEELDRAT